MARADGTAFARLRELFHASVELSPEAQRQFLANLSAQDRVHADELAELLAVGEGGADPAAVLAQGELALRAAAPASLVGQRVGAWRLERLLGRGGMGEVFLGVRADGVVRQRAAVKVVRPSLASGELRQRFRSERQLLASLEHPGIARLLDAGASEDGVPFLAMELVEGSDLEQHCAERRLAVPDRLRLFLAACAAVEHAHRNLVIHRDLKPSNIMVSADGEVKLLDFGVAKLLGGDDQQVTQAITQVGALALSPAFASPEQLAGRAASTATDIYSLGVLLFRLLTGGHPYELSDLPLTGVARVVAEQAPQPPSSAVLATIAVEATRLRPPGDVRRLSRQLRGDLDTITLTALRKEPERRYPSVAALAEDVRRYLGGLPVLARGDSVRYRTAKLLRRHRLAVVALALALAFLVAGTALSLWQARVATEERDRAREANRRSEETNRLLRSVLTGADPVQGEGRGVRVADLLAGASRRLGPELAGQPAIEASLRETLGETYRNLGLTTEAAAELERAVALRLGTHDSLATARSRVLRGLIRSDQGRLQAAELDLRAALAVLRDGGGDRVVAQALDGLLVTLRHQGRNDEAVAAGEAAVALLRERLPGERALLASTLNNLALAFGESGRLAAAERVHREALELIRAERGTRHPQTAEAMANLAGILDMQGRFAEAEPLYHQALSTQEELLGEQHPDYLRTLTSWANMLWLLHRPAEAEPPARRARDLAARFLGADHPLTAYAENILGGILLDLGRAAEAETVIRASLAQRRRQLPAGHWLIASAQSNLGAALMAQGRLDDADRELREAYRSLLADRGPEHEKTRLTAGRLAALASRRAGRPWATAARP